MSKDFTNNWDYIQSCFFALTILTTIGMNLDTTLEKYLSLKYLKLFAGYGNFAVETFEGRFFCLFFGIIGIPLMLSVLADVGGIFAGILQLAWDKNKSRLTLIARKLHLLKPG